MIKIIAKVTYQPTRLHVGFVNLKKFLVGMGLPDAYQMVTRFTAYQTKNSLNDLINKQMLQK